MAFGKTWRRQGDLGEAEELAAAQAVESLHPLLGLQPLEGVLRRLRLQLEAEQLGFQLEVGMVQVFLESAAQQVEISGLAADLELVAVEEQLVQGPDRLHLEAAVVAEVLVDAVGLGPDGDSRGRDRDAVLDHGGVVVLGLLLVPDLKAGEGDGAAGVALPAADLGWVESGPGQGRLFEPFERREGVGEGGGPKRSGDQAGDG